MIVYLARKVEQYEAPWIISAHTTEAGARARCEVAADAAANWEEDLHPRDRVTFTWTEAWTSTNAFGDAVPHHPHLSDPDGYWVYDVAPLEVQTP